MAESVRGKLKSGIIWSTIQNFALKGVGFVLGIILARLLSPSDYGLVAMLSIFLAISDQITNAGMSAALVQKHNCSDVDYSTAFVVNFAMSLVMYAVLFFSAPWIAKFYEQPILCALTRVIAINMVLKTFTLVYGAKLYIASDFKSIAQINVIISFASGIVGVILAYEGFGVWALAIQGLSSTIISVIIYPLYAKWKPSLKFSKKSFKEMFGYGSKLMVAGIGSSIMNNLQNIAIGKVYSSSDLGFYNKGQGIPATLSDVTYSVLGNVAFPVMSEIKDDKEHLLSVYKKSLFLTAMIIFPVMVLFALLAKPLVIILYTDKWLPCVAFMVWFSMAKMFYPLSALNISILNASGRSGTFLLMDMSKYPLMIIMLLITIPLGPKAMAIGSFATSFICFFINAYFPGKLYNYGALKQIKDWRYILLSVAIMSACVIGILYVFDNIWAQAIIGGVVGIAIYIICCFAFKIADRKAIMNHIKIKLSRK